LARQRLKKNQASPARVITPGRVGILLLFLAALWVGSGFVNKMVVAYRLDAEAGQLRQENQRLAETNRGYQSQLSALSQPGGKEEQERLHNYVQKDEKVYVIAQPSPGPSPTPRPSPGAAGGGVQTSAAGFFQDLWGAVTSAFH
jgi:cell division protein FtsB